MTNLYCAEYSCPPTPPVCDCLVCCRERPLHLYDSRLWYTAIEVDWSCMYFITEVRGIDFRAFDWLFHMDYKPWKYERGVQWKRFCPFPE